MERLEVSVVESKKGFEDLWILEEGVYGTHNRGKDLCFGIGRVENVPAGYWKGFLENDELFHIAYFNINEEFRGNGYGNNLVAHQLKFAKSKGCITASSLVRAENLQSLAIHKKFGGEILNKYGVCSDFRFDLRGLNF